MLFGCCVNIVFRGWLFLSSAYWTCPFVLLFHQNCFEQFSSGDVLNRNRATISMLNHMLLSEVQRFQLAYLLLFLPETWKIMSDHKNCSIAISLYAQTLWTQQGNSGNTSTSHWYTVTLESIHFGLAYIYITRLSYTLILWYMR